MSPLWLQLRKNFQNQHFEKIEKKSLRYFAYQKCEKDRFEKFDFEKGNNVVAETKIP